MTFRTHEVPVVVGRRPVQRVARRDPLVRLQMKPALPSVLCGTRVPRHGERLIPAAGERNEVLLQRMGAERVGDFVIVKIPIGTFRADEILFVLLEKSRRHSEVSKGCVVEVAEDGVFVRHLHGEIVMGALPELSLLLVTTGAGLAADIPCRARWLCRHNVGLRDLAKRNVKKKCHSDRDQDPAGEDSPPHAPYHTVTALRPPYELSHSLTSVTGLATMASFEETFMRAVAAMSLLVCLVATVAILSAQSLAEVAKQERKRREKLPPSEVVRDEDLIASGENASVSEMGTDSEVAAFPIPEPAEERTASDWPSIFANCRSRYDAAKAVRDEKQDLIVTGLPIGTDLGRIPCARIMILEFTPGWIRYAIDCERLEEEVDEQEAEMRLIQEECFNEARIRNIPPGEARLN